MTFGTNNGQTAGSLHLVSKFNIGTTSGHVGGDGYGTEHALFFNLVALLVGKYHFAHSALSCFGHDVGLLLVKFGVKHLMGYATELEHTAEEFAHVDVGRTNQYGTSGQTHLFNFLDNRLVLFAFGLINAVVHVNTRDRTVGWNFHYIEFVDIPELAYFGACSTGHTSQLVVHTEIVLQCDGGKSLCGGFNLYVLLCLNSLVQAIAPTAAFHNTACLFVDNLNLAVHYHIFLVDTEHGVGFEQLQYGVYALALDGVILQQGVLFV